MKTREYAFFKKAKLDFNNKWTINGENVDMLINKAIKFFNDNSVISNNSVNNYYNVSYCIDRFQRSESYSNIDIIRSWLDMFFENVSTAVYLDAYRGINDVEKVKTKAAELALATFQKEFA